MRIDFNVLWIDDQPQSVNAQIEAIKRRMADEGFEFNAPTIKPDEDITSVISDSVFADEIDLILVDWDLGSEMEGQDKIVEIRHYVQYKDVVFYSARTTPKELRKAAFERELEGVYCADRESLVEEVMGVFESLVKKVLDLDHTRGIVMGATSDIDEIVKECLRFSLDRHLDQEDFFKIVATYITKSMKEINKQAESLKKATTLDELFMGHMILSSDYRLRILAKLLQHQRLSSHTEYRAIITKYQQQVIPRRNKLGHVSFSPKEEQKERTETDSKQVSLKESRELRCQILELRAKFRQLLDALETGVLPASDVSTSTDTE